LEESGTIGRQMLIESSDTGEHISNEKNELVYAPFPVCNETGKPLELQYGIEEGIFLSWSNSGVE
jgi:hypothetical protein